jgi:mannose-6-phosphate isomerase-like protein (cupin superfamily)
MVEGNQITGSALMDLNAVKESIVKNVYHLDSEKKVPLHQHADQDEIFYCMKGSGSGVLKDREVKLDVGQSFIVPAGTLHTLRTEGELYVSSFLIPIVDDRM